MSKVFNMVGGGGGATASIFVTGLSQTDTVTATNGSKTLTGKWVTTQKTVDVQVPTMTSNTSPSGECSASGYRDGQPAYKAFDRTDDYWCIDSQPTTSNPQWIQYKFDAPVCVTSMMYSMIENDNSRVRDCIIQCSNDGVNFTDVYSTDIPTSPAKVTITFENTIFAQYWRLKILSNNGKPTNVYVRELQFYGIKISDVYGHMLSPIRDLGTWTVTATNGTKTATQDVLVDVITEYEIEMSYKLWLYKDGDECEDVTGGWSFSGYNTGSSTLQEPTKNNDSVTLYCNKNNYVSFVGTVNPISFNGYSKLKCCIKNVSINGTYAGSTIDFEVQKTTVSTSGQYVYFVTSSEESECEIDISEYQGTYYVSVQAFNATSKADLTKVWLE